jgi:hypothetical protein
MSQATFNGLEAMVSWSRRSIWCAVWVALFLGAVGVVLGISASPHLVVMAGTVMKALPIFIVIIVVALISSRRRVGASSEVMRTIQNDELRLAALTRAYRNGFCATLGAQVLVAITLMWWPVSNPLLLLLCTTTCTGIVTLLGSFLYYDR